MTPTRPITFALATLAATFHGIGIAEMACGGEDVGCEGGLKSSSVR
jgi:hypothetical protein